MLGKLCRLEKHCGGGLSQLAIHTSLWGFG